MAMITECMLIILSPMGYFLCNFVNNCLNYEMYLLFVLIYLALFYVYEIFSKQVGLIMPVGFNK